MSLQVTFLGTSGAVPTTDRNPSGLFVRREGDAMLFDAGEGTQRQMMRFGTGFDVRWVFLSHLHGDHVLGIPGLLQTMDFNERSDPLTIFTPQGTGRSIRNLIYAIGPEPSYGVDVVEVGPGETVVDAGAYDVRTFATEHRTRSVGYALVEADRKGRFDRERAEELGVPVGPKFSALHEGEPVELEDGTVIEPNQVVGPPRPGRTVVYTGDTRPVDSVVEAASGADLLIHDATFAESSDERARETGHSTAREAGEVADRADVERLVLTHISSRYAGDTGILKAEAEAAFDGRVLVARDGDDVDVPYSEKR
ncbi:ribonuclease Z [Halanaeroarchaeum sulfurireducens]|uniref:Ribonuclease Z n=1 Tax=Halanaeroarchaeum sulfurireducens TaxID=1604004 RepID=A0A0F7PCS9_9EURY|nr:ribonuclease Z [Halanaeroarchaeum sulfurireducens]AKH98512.1 ribonuclease Z [Halanaeroarchaeum sulfurireducens]ALG82954.1 ribonuclease Z [Halanaeroarchaeum sulfurireducens]